MTERDVLMHILASTVGPNPALREALSETLLALLSDDDAAAEPPLSYPELLEQLARQRKAARDSGNARLDAALRNLNRQLLEELQRSARTVHAGLTAGQPPDAAHLGRIGIDAAEFPVGIDPAYNLRHLSENYRLLVQDARALERANLPHLLPLMQQLQQRHRRMVRLLRDVAWEALSTGLFPDQELLHFSDRCKHALQSRRQSAEDALADLLNGQTSLTIAAVVPTLTDWLYEYGRLHWPLLYMRLPQARSLVLEALARMPDPIGLEALATLPVKGRDAAFLLMLLTLRFGDIDAAPVETWALRLKTAVDAATQRPQAREFWNAHPYLLPDLLLESFRALPLPEALRPAIPDILQRKIAAAYEDIPLEAILKRHGAARAEDEAKPLARTVGGAVEFALDAVKEGNLVEAALVTALDKGTGGLRDQLTVTLDEEDEDADAARVARSQPASRQPGPPDVDVWQDRILPFIMQNWAPLLGGGMVLTGLLLLEFYIWEKAAWIRYGASPLITALVALVLTVLGRRLNRDAERFETSLAIIQGMAVFLAPLSLLFVTLFFVDSDLALTYRALGGVALSAALLSAWSLVFVLAMRAVNRALTTLYSGTLLALNGLLLLPALTRVVAPAGHWGMPAAEGVLTVGLYAGFAVLGWSIQRALKRVLRRDAEPQHGMIFYSVTGLGTFALVWGLIYAHVGTFPPVFTYGPLLILAALLCLRLESMLLDHRAHMQPVTARDRITPLSYAAYALICLGLLMSLGQDYARVAALLLAGAVWAYQAYVLRRLPPPPGLKSRASIRHEHIALTLVVLGLSLVAMIRPFPAEGFPFLALGIAVALHLLARHPALLTDTAFASALSPISLTLAFAVSVVWQWSQQLDPSGFGAAFLLYGAFVLYLGAASGRLIHVHAGMGYCAAALPYLGMVDMELFTLDGNTLVFGLACLGMAWAGVSSLAPVTAFRDSRSTVLWNIGILAVCLLGLRVLLQEPLAFADTSRLLLSQMLSAPILIGGLMLLVGFWSNSYPAIYLALAIFLFIFPDIKEQVLEYPGVQTLVVSGLGTSLTALALVALVAALHFWKPLRAVREHDLIWRQKAFPFQAADGYRLFAHPLMAAALFLFARNLLYHYPRVTFFRPYSADLLTCLAVALAGSGCLALSLWYRKPWFAYLGFLSIAIGSVHAGAFDEAPLFVPGMMPVLLLAALLYGQAVCAVLPLVFPDRARRVTRPFRHVRFFFIGCLAVTAFPLYALFRLGRVYDGAGLWHWLPLLVYCCATAGWMLWRTARLWKAWFIAIPGYLALWQTVLVVVAAWWPIDDFLNAAPILMPLMSAAVVFGVAVIVLASEWRLPVARFRLLSPLLWLSLLFLGVLSLLAVVRFFIHTAAFLSVSHLRWELALLAAVSLLLGRFLRMAPLWLWALVLLHLLLLPSVPDYVEFYAALPPLALAGAACVTAAFALITRQLPQVYAHRYRWPWSAWPWNTPPVVLAAASQALVVAAFWQASFHPAHQAAWPTVLGLFVATLPALIVAPYCSISRRLLFSLPYLGAWIALSFAAQANLAPQFAVPALPPALLISCGLFGAVGTLLLSDGVRPSTSRGYALVQYVSALLLLVGVVSAYAPVRNLQALSWPHLLASAILLFGSALFFRRYAKL